MRNVILFYYEINMVIKYIFCKRKEGKERKEKKKNANRQKAVLNVLPVWFLF